ncbi:MULTISPECIES: ELM1/GtrOC1 family putative glycosyltransferase [unclassified Polynucleobacter]|jgi:mitochondrial fission protein ELM1|uniref:ELM1/GtrOC1 family putative glycosyltransferase n=1 Tax=unclassified Polynucleobacter TaxID=2640945 RepID=UPI001C0CD730|nr:MULTISPECIES: ELM1/GtrOC1 family putative glycosyltransferase [unclassified Polynucleobacter]MBU3590416.1 mitochondrial fission ELM1 family protein [Polynucleobacter sp. 78F-HAINBA]MCX7237114.1 ELM1/GtrOC1 family putative glycosyltransferase [Polynucleobacter sp.]
MNILILDDGRAGHRKQAMALFALTNRILAKKGIGQKEIDCKIITTNFDNLLQKIVYKIIFGNLIKSDYLLNLVAKILTPSIILEISKFSPDLIISCGYSSSCMSAISSNKDALKIAILYPGANYADKFSLVITPQHDLVKIEDISNIVTTKFALTEDLIHCDRGAKKLKLGLLVGGNSNTHSYTKKFSRNICEGLISFVKTNDLEVMWTPSRRTPPYFLSIFDDALMKSDGVRHLFKCLTSPNASEDILRECDWVLVSADSISMISEALAAGCKVTVFRPPRRLGFSKKNRAFINSLEALGYIRVCEIDEISRQQYPMTQENSYKLFCEDRNSIEKSISQLLHRF